MPSADYLYYLVAFAAGVLSFVSPCVLPMIPSYITFITGISLKDFKDEEQKDEIRRTTAIHSLFFILGFSIVFIVLGASASLFSQAAFEYRDIVRQVGAVLIIFFGLYIAGAFRFLFLEKERRLHLEKKPVGYIGTMLVGITFSAGWTPCVGPVLASILIMAGTSDNFFKGLNLLILYSLGMALPFFLCSIFINSFLIQFSKISKYLPIINIVCGVFLVLVGILLFFDLFVSVSVWFNYLFEGLATEAV